MEDESTKKKTDRRVLKTKRAIRNAFASLLTEKDITEISVKDIADRAEVDRKTVYAYYNGGYEIMEELENELITSFGEVIDRYDYAKDYDNPYHVFEILTEEINKDLGFYGQFMKMNSKSQLSAKIYTLLKSEIRKALATTPIRDKNKLDLISEFITAGMIRSYQSWFNSGCAQPLESFSKDVGTVVISGVNGFFEK